MSLLQSPVAVFTHVAHPCGSPRRARTTHATAANETSSRSHAVCEFVLRDSSDRFYGAFLLCCYVHPPSVHLTALDISGKLSLVDLAGSERAADARHHNRQRRMESAEINKSLLALKECIRWGFCLCVRGNLPCPRELMQCVVCLPFYSAIDVQGKHVPFRASKLTLLLKDSFTSKLSKVVMIAAVSPAMSASDHTINTLRYMALELVAVPRSHSCPHRYADRVKEKAVEGEDCEDLSDVSEEEEEEGGMMSPIGGAPSGPPVAAAAAGRPSGDKKPDRSSVPSSGPPRYSPLTVQGKCPRAFRDTLVCMSLFACMECACTFSHSLSLTQSPRLYLLPVAGLGRAMASGSPPPHLGCAPLCCVCFLRVRAVLCFFVRVNVRACV